MYGFGVCRETLCAAATSKVGSDDTHAPPESEPQSRLVHMFGPYFAPCSNWVGRCEPLAQLLCTGGGRHTVVTRGPGQAGSRLHEPGQQ